MRPLPTVVGTLLLSAGGLLAAAEPALSQAPPPPPAAPAAPKEPGAVAELKTAQGQKLGEARLTETPHGVLIQVSLSNVAAGPHAFHIHAAGKCESPKFDSAGPHFNPAAKKHGLHAAAGPHAGDLPNVHVPASGSLEFEFVAAGVNLKPGDAQSLFDADGAALVIHAKGDDYQTDPSGAAGDRLACGVIEKKK